MLSHCFYSLGEWHGGQKSKPYKHMYCTSYKYSRERGVGVLCRFFLINSLGEWHGGVMAYVVFIFLTEYTQIIIFLIGTEYT